jgi:hypothetical protein
MEEFPKEEVSIMFWLMVCPETKVFFMSTELKHLSACTRHTIKSSFHFRSRPSVAVWKRTLLYFLLCFNFSFYRGCKPTYRKNRSCLGVDQDNATIHGLLSLIINIVDNILGISVITILDFLTLKYNIDTFSNTTG